MSTGPTKGKVRRRYLKIEDTIYNSPAFRTLPPSALKLWIDMRVQFNGANNGNINAAMSTLAHRDWSSPETLANALKELMARGLIDRTRKGKPGPYRVCSLFRFTDLATAKNETLFVEGRQATNDFLNWQPTHKPKKICATKIEAVPLRKSKGYRYENRSVEPAAATKIEARKNGEIASNAPPINALQEIGDEPSNASKTEVLYRYQGNGAASGARSERGPSEGFPVVGCPTEKIARRAQRGPEYRRERYEQAKAEARERNRARHARRP